MGRKDNLNVHELDEYMRVRDPGEWKIKWYDPRISPFQVSGFAWFEKENIYRRLPNQPIEPIPDPVDNLANCTTGGQIRFRTTSTRLHIRVKLSGKANMSHMTAIGQCGFDCYIGELGKQRFYNSTLYNHQQDAYENILIERKTDDWLMITLNFPLYQGVEEVLIGLDNNAVIKSPPAYDCPKKIIFYGTSITQGGCASRPGLAYTNILSRRINQEFINLGFSGNGKGEDSLARVISTIKNPGCLVLDYEPNCVSTELYMKTLPNFILTYRQSHPNIPILLISKFPYAEEQMNHSLLNERLERLAFQKKLVNHLRKDGDKQIYFLEGTDLLGENFTECTIDGIHPNDLGFMSIADQLTPVLKRMLNN